MPSSSDQRTRNIVQGMGSLTAQYLGTSILGLIFQISLLRLLSPTQYGVYAGISVAIGIALTFASLGLNQAVARYLAFLQQQDEAKSWVAARKILYLTLALTIVVTAAYSFLAPNLSLYFTKSKEWTDVFLLSGLWLLLSPVGAVCQGIVQGLRRYTLLAKMLFLSKLSMVVFASVVLFFYRSVDIAIFAWVINGSIIIAWTMGITSGKITQSKGEFEYSTVLRYSYPLGIAGIITIISTSADIVVVGGYLDPISLGVYNAAVTISTILTLVFVSPLITALLPELSSSSSEDKISYGVKLSFRFLLLIALPASLLVTSLSKQLIDLFTGGGEYLRGAPSLELIAIFYLFLAIETILIVVFQATGKTINAMIIGIVSAACDIGVSVALVPHLGLLGAATAKASVGIVGAILGFYLARRYLGMLDNMGFYVKAGVSAVIPFVVTFILSSYVSARVISLVPYTIVFALLFLACVKLLKLLSPEDKVLISHALPNFLQGVLNFL
jgi:O-antigen/teichoic acid export membrane protein